MINPDNNSTNNTRNILNTAPNFYESFINELDISYLSFVEGESPNLNENKHFFCNKCFKVPLIQFISFTKIIYSCDCKKCNENEFQKLEDIKYEEINEDEIKKYLYCNEHQLVFNYYCKT